MEHPVWIFTKESVVFQLPSLLGLVQDLDMTLSFLYVLSVYE